MLDNAKKFSYFPHLATTAINWNYSGKQRAISYANSCKADKHMSGQGTAPNQVFMNA